MLLPFQLQAVPESSINTADSFYDVLLWASSSMALRGIQCQLREVEGCAHMLLGNDSFCVPTQPADRQTAGHNSSPASNNMTAHTGGRRSGSAATPALARWSRTGWAYWRIKVFTQSLHQIVLSFVLKWKLKATFFFYSGHCCCRSSYYIMYISGRCLVAFWQICWGLCFLMEWSCACCDKQSFIPKQRCDDWCHLSSERLHSFIQWVTLALMGLLLCFQPLSVSPQHLQVWRAQCLPLRPSQCRGLPDLLLYRDAL